ncbi:ATP12 family chaperone protein [Arenibacterium sp. CAU 1754]
MSEWKQRRFWKEVAVNPTEDGFGVQLDGRQVKTPAKAVLALPTHEMAQAVAQEWDAQQGTVNPLTMPFTRSANAAIDKVRHQHGEVADMLAAYGDSDLLCYRAEMPAELVQRQADQWNPALDWAKTELDVVLNVHAGVIHRAQPADALQRLSDRVHKMTAFELAAFHDLVSLSGSLILGLAATRDWRDIETLWVMSRLDELWQEEQWGPDDEARAQAELKRQAFMHAKRFFDLAQA